MSRDDQLLFQPKLIGKDYVGIHEMVYKSVMKCDMEVRRDLFCNILMTGGGGAFSQMNERMSVEMNKLTPQTMDIEIRNIPEKKYSVWIGGSVLSSLSLFQEQWISKDEYDESGPSIVHRRYWML